MPKEAKENQSFVNKLLSKANSKSKLKKEDSPNEKEEKKATKTTSKENKTSKKVETKTSKKSEKENKTTTKKAKVADKKDDTKKLKDNKKEKAKKVSTTTKKAATTKKKSTSTKQKKLNEENIETTLENISDVSTTLRSKTAFPEDFSVLEYYDLPYRYNQTVVKVLAQTPTTLFVYWDISDIDRENYKKQYGENFFEVTKPVLNIFNETMNYHFEVDINDFANCWYLNVNDSKCKYKIELGRRPIHTSVSIPSVSNNYVPITSSNVIEAPNDHILIDQKQEMIYFKNVKTNAQRAVKTASISFIRNMGRIYNIYDLYKQIYKDENIEEFYDLSNPSSKGNPSSKFK